MDHLPATENKLLQELGALDLHPIKANVADLVNYKKYPLSSIAKLGIDFGLIASSIQGTIYNSYNAGGSGLYKVTLPECGHLAMRRDGSGYLGAVLGNGNNRIMGQATLSPVGSAPSLTCNPAMLVMAATLISINRKLDSIQETQREILDFLVQKDRAELEGNLNILFEELKNYQYNWNNEMFRQNRHNKVLDIKQSAEQKIIFCQKQIEAKTHIKNLQRLASEFRDYQLALYVYSFSASMDVLFLGNFSADFIDNIIKSIDNAYFTYRQLYVKSCNKLEHDVQTSKGSQILKELSAGLTSAGKTIRKIPVINKSSINGVRMKAGEQSNCYKNQQSDRVMSVLTDCDTQIKDAQSFIEILQTVSQLHNKTSAIVIDQENLYIENTE